MIDIKLIRENREKVEALLRRKDPTLDLSAVVDLDHKIRMLKTKGEQLKSRRNAISKQIGEMKRKGESETSLMDEVSSIATEAHAIDHELLHLEEEFTLELSKLPKRPMEDVKISQDPKENVVIKEYGKKPEFDFPFKH